MKLLHLSDLHLGKKICEMPMIEEQRYIFEQIFSITAEEKIDVVIIAGDVYDKSIPSVEAVGLFDSIVDRFHEMGIPMLIISGNHDSAQRISFGSEILKKQGIYFGTEISHSVEPVVLSDDYGKVNFYLLPFLRPIEVNHIFDKSFENYTDAIAYMIEKMSPDFTQRNVIVSHQFVSGAALSESETMVGGTECVDGSVYNVFDYAALGHIHSPQHIKNKNIRYCGTPLKYSLSEVNTVRSVTIVELREKNDIQIRTVPLVPEHDMRKIKGNYDELVSVENTSDDYIYAELTDDHDIPFAAAGLRNVYRNLISVSYQRMEAYRITDISTDNNLKEEKTPEEIFTDLYRAQHGDLELDEIKLELLKKALENMEEKGSENL